MAAGDTDTAALRGSSEQVFAGLIDGSLVRLPSGLFANNTWLALTAMVTT